MISGSILLIIRKENGIHCMPYVIHCIPCSSRINSDVFYRCVTIKTLELQTGVLSTLAVCYLDDIT